MDAPRIRIPERYQAGIAKLITLPDDGIEELLSILNETPLSLNLDSIKDYIISQISSIPEDDIDEIISALDSLYIIQDELSAPIQEFSEQVLQAMAEAENSVLHLESSHHEHFKDRLTKLMNGKLLRLVVKSRDILFEQERTFGSARVLSDIRTVFGDHTESAPDAAIIVHMLKIHYIQDNQHKEFFVALDTGDIDLLIDTLIRAQEKAETLKSLLAAANVPYINAE
jgi:hypothetical protein